MLLNFFKLFRVVEYFLGILEFKVIKQEKKELHILCMLLDGSWKDKSWDGENSEFGVVYVVLSSFTMIDQLVQLHFKSGKHLGIWSE